ncbi:cytochrome P450, partial [Vararia minispora EC-137]
ALYTLYIRPVYVSPLRKVPGPPLRRGPLGHFLEMMVSEPGAMSSVWAHKYGPVVRMIGPFGTEALFFFHPEALKKILVTDCDNYPRPMYLRDFLGLAAGYGLLTTIRSEHHQLRKLLNPAFSISNINAQVEIYFQYIESIVHNMRKELEGESDGKVLHMCELMGRLTLHIICETAFGYPTDSQSTSHSDLMAAYRDMATLQSGSNISKVLALEMVPGAPAFLRSEWGAKFHSIFSIFPSTTPASTLVKAAWRLRQVSRRILQDKIAESELHPEDFANRKDIMSQLLRARNAEMRDGQRLTDNELVEQVMTFLGAGQETTASGLSWTLWLLASHPVVQQQLREEVAHVFDGSASPDYKEFKDLRWLNCVVMESLRLLPPIPLTLRQAMVDDYIDGTFVPKGTLIYVPLRSINTWKETWGPDAEDFKPERWLDPTSNPKYDATFSFLGFLAGPHGCIGKTMAISEMKAVIAAMVANFEFSPAYEGQAIETSAAISMSKLCSDLCAFFANQLETIDPKDNTPLLVRPIRR